VTERELLARTAAIAADYLETLDTRPVRPERRYREMLALLDSPLPEHPTDPAVVVEELAAVAEPGIMAIGSGRWFGFVAGGALPGSLASDWLVSAWDQNTGLAEPTPSTSALEASPAGGCSSCSGFPPTPRSRSSPGVRWPTSRVSRPRGTPSTGAPAGTFRDGDSRARRRCASSWAAHAT